MRSATHSAGWKNVHPVGRVGLSILAPGESAPEPGSRHRDCGQGGAFDLHINGRQQPEVQILGNHIRRQETKGGAAKVGGQHIPQRGDIVGIGWCFS
jgi:hypothetical protein